MEQKKMKWPRGKVILLLSIVIIYISLGLGFKYAAEKGLVARDPPSEFLIPSHNLTLPVEQHLQAAAAFVDKILNKEGHIDLYYLIESDFIIENHDHTNSEAISYYLLWNAQENRKKSFDNMLDFTEKYMLHPTHGYLMWRLDEDNEAAGEGRNIASDADLRMIHALLLAQQKWPDTRYTKLISDIADALEKIAITPDGFLAPYGGVSGENDVWIANEVWLSYMDFQAVAALAQRRGEPWASLYQKMKKTVLAAQLENGLYNSQLTQQRRYGNALDEGGYSINSLWIMVRNAESDDLELHASAQKSLNFYKEKYEQDNILYTSYDSSGNPVSSHDAPWVYALVGRAAVHLGDREFSKEMIERLLQFQVTDVTSPLYGGIPEGVGENPRIGQFTMQESILTMQQYVQKYPFG